MTDFHSICYNCGGKCCIDAKPPVTKRRLKILLEAGIDADCFEFGEYIHPKVKNNGYCIFFDEVEKKCKIHELKPETCVAGPFTFDLKDKLEIYLKKKTICPIVSVLEQNRTLYEEQFTRAVATIIRLIEDLDDRELKKILEIEEEEIEKVAELDICDKCPK